MCRIFSCFIERGCLLWPRERDIKKLHSVCTCKKEKPCWDIENRCPSASQEGLSHQTSILQTPWYWTSFQNDEKMKLFYLSHPVYVILLSQPQEKTFCNTIWLVLFFFFLFSFSFTSISCVTISVWGMCVCVYCCVCCSVKSISLSLHELVGSSVYGTSLARKLEWVAMSSSRGSSWHRDQIHISCTSCLGRQILHHWATWEHLWCT